MRLLRDRERLHHLGERFAVSGQNLDLTKLSHDLFRPAPLRCQLSMILTNEAEFMASPESAA
jgi:hypothetical protein